MSTIEEGEGDKDSVVQILVDETTLFLALGEVIDVAKEKKRLLKEIEKLSGEANKIKAKLSNEKFMTRAPDHVIEEQRVRLSEAEQARHKLEGAVGRLGA